ncbi:hypothetical protein RhiirB3_523551 [Rhizophagus irregularis]|nr:hypothetical protein RhiirB3_523551 [Rhizophagus irregularis]
MSSQLPTECLNNIFEYLEDDKTTLYSCLLVNRLYCKVAVEILWKDVWNFQNNNYEPKTRLSIFNMLITFLTKESMERLRNSGINFINFTEKHALFNYPSFCKVISYVKIKELINWAIVFKQINILGVFNHGYHLLIQEILKMFMNQVTSLKSLDYSFCIDSNVEFIYSPGTKICLKDLVELRCDTNISPEFFSQLSQICHHIQSLIIFFLYSNKYHKINIPDGLTDLISSQNNLKSLELKNDCNEKIIRILTPSLVKSSLTITNIGLYTCNESLSFISMFKNLQEINLWLDYTNNGDIFGFENLQFINFPNLKILRFKCEFPKIEFLTNFLEINGKNLTEFYINDGNKSINLAISKYCPNIKNLYLNFIEDNDDELIILKKVLNNCQFLESILVQIHQITCSKKLFGILGEYSSKNFHELKIKLELKSTCKVLIGLEEYFINWKKFNNNPQKLLSLNIMGHYSEIYDPKVIMIIEKYMKMGLLKNIIFNGIQYMCNK